MNNDQEAYKNVLEIYKARGAKHALKPMQAFIQNYPNSVYRGNAYFWLGEFYLALEPTNYQSAKSSFNTVLTQYPKSTKAPTATYRLYNIMLNVDHNTKKANQYKNMIKQQYPNSEEAQFVK